MYPSTRPVPVPYPSRTVTWPTRPPVPSPLGGRVGGTGAAARPDEVIPSMDGTGKPGLFRSQREDHRPTPHATAAPRARHAAASAWAGVGVARVAGGDAATGRLVGVVGDKA